MLRPLSVTTKVSSSFNVATYITLSRQKSFFKALLLSQQAFPCCNNQYRDRDSTLCSSFCCNINLSVAEFFLYYSLISCRDRRYLVAIEFLSSSCFICSDRSFFVTTISSYFLSVFCNDTLSFFATKLICQYSDLCVATKEILS